MGIRQQLPQVRTGLVLVSVLVAALFFAVEPGLSQDAQLPDDAPALLAEVVVTDDGGFELYSLHAATGDRLLLVELTVDDIDAAKALAETLGQGVQIAPLDDDVASAQLALRLPQVFAVTDNQCALVSYMADGKTGTLFFDC